MAWRRLACVSVTFLLMGVLPRTALAAAPLSDAGPLLQEMGKQIQDQSLPTTERLQIIGVFGAWATAQVVPPLLAALKDPKPEIREAAAQALGWRGNKEAVQGLRERVESPDEVAAVKAAAVRSLGRIGDASVRPLVIALTRDPDTSIRQAAVWSVALGLLVDPTDQTGYLIEVAEDRKEKGQVRADAIRTLVQKGKEERVVNSLMGILEHEPRLKVELPSPQPTQDQIVYLRYTQANDVPAWAAGALGALDARVALPLLLKAAEDPQDYFLRLMALDSLVTWNVPEAFPVYVGRLEDPLQELRLAALAGLEKLGDPRGVDPVLAHLNDSNPTVRARVVTVLASLGGSKVRPQLEALDEKEIAPEVLQALEAALKQPAR
ncbi:MAG TPA: HEAT repeat domain-containing protein [Candidatus Methylomirabilis sp.]|nr:HEAT repeat domain-containing protein [Candidatus Methylomirabilis sp.]